MRFQRVSSKCATTEGRGGNLGNRSGWPRPPVALIGVALLIPGLITTARAATCESLAGLKLATTTISSAQLIPAGAFKPPAGSATGPVQALFKGMPAFCRVQGVLKPSTDSYIEFEVWLPVSAWNGKYQGTGNGGFAGSIGYVTMASALANGYATSSTDTGHKGGATDGEWALGHYEKIVDFGYRAIHETADKSKSIIQAFYNDKPKHSYFSSCSNGGRQALLEAQRYPADYDGIIAGAPANFWTHLIAGAIWNAQALNSGYIPASKLNAIAAAAVSACDRIDGVQDGVIDDPTKCRFDPAVLRCQGAESDNCLTDAQVAALKKIYAGPKTSKGEQIFPGSSPGGELGTAGWASWITGPTQGKSVQLAFGHGFFGDMVFQDAAWDFRSFNFDRDLKITDDKMARIMNATDPNLKPFKDRGGKLILYHGWSDAAIAPVNTVNYYESVVSKMGRKEADDFVELYMVPGMQHCGGGPGPNEFGAAIRTQTDPQHNMAMALERWVEKGTAPDKIIGTKFQSDSNPSSAVLRTRPLCPYPLVARYQGSGSTDNAASFACVAK